jgi:outer membrane protein OmpA-like peptidoglycan-associated protein
MTRIRTYTLLALGTFGVGACVHTPPEELVDARSAFASARGSYAPTLVPAELHQAEEALAAAEVSFKEHPKAYETLDLAYVAQRKAEGAEALGSLAHLEATTAAADADYVSAQGAMLQDTQARLDVATTDLGTAEQARQTAEEARLTAEMREAAALAELSSARQEARGMVITLSGSVLFRTDEAILLPSAQARLDQVANALLAQPTRTLVIEGHTDSRGDDGHNLELSQRRAEAVRSFLVSKGYAASRIQASGVGEVRPIADNGTQEGMANNRRVEIVVQK